MPRQNRRRDDAWRPPELTVASTRIELLHGVAFSVRSVSGNGPERSYRCPGCDHEIRGGPHIVAWPADHPDADDRRHWHTPCWAARERRRATGRRHR